MPETPLPLTTVRVVDLTDGLGESAGRLLADLGATVHRVELPGGSTSRRSTPAIGDTGIGYALNNANKLVVTADPADPDDQRQLRQLVDDADIVLCSLPAARLAGFGLDPVAVRVALPDLVWLTLSPFGDTGPYADYRADEAVLYAMSGVLSRSGVPGAPPLLPPRELFIAALRLWKSQTL